MNCSTSQRLLQLNRPGERSPAEEAGLRDHLAGCASCAADVKRVGRLGDVESAWRSADIPVPDLRHIRARVLAATSDGRQVRLTTRLVYAVAAVALVSWFIAGQATVRLAQSRLHENAVVTTSRGSGPEVMYAVDPRSIADISRILPIQTNRLTGEIEVAQSEVGELMRLSEHQFQRASLQGPERRARLDAVAKVVRSSISIAIRFRTPGA